MRGYAAIGIHQPKKRRRVSLVADLRDALIQAEACMSIVEPRSDKAEYLRILGVVRAALAKAEGR